MGRASDADANNFSIVKDGTGSQVINFSFYTGTTTVNAGSLYFRGGAASATGAVAVNSGATLGGLGTIGGAITVNAGGSLAPGEGVGTLTTNAAVTLDAGSTFAVEGDSGLGTIDLLVANAAVTIGSGAALSGSDISGAPAVLPLGAKLPIIDYSGGSLTGTFAGLPEGSALTVGLNTYMISYVDNSMVTLTTVMGGGSAYDTWAAGFPGLTGGFDDNDDGDALTNGQEWYFGGSDPTDSGDTGKTLGDVTSTGLGVFTFSHLRPTNTSGATASYEWSATLRAPFIAGGDSDGIYMATLTPGAATPDITGYESVVVTVTSTPAAPELFARVRLTMP